MYRATVTYSATRFPRYIDILPIYMKREELDDYSYYNYQRKLLDNFIIIILLFLKNYKLDNFYFILKFKFIKECFVDISSS